MTTALIMAGGRSERMRASLGCAHKALVRVDGATLLEWNLCAVLAAGIRDMFVAVSQRDPEVERFVRTRCAELCLLNGAEVECVIEGEPLGSIGVARQFAGRTDALLVIYVDNLTSLDLAALVEQHARVGAAMTTATHVEPFRIPFGEVVVSDGLVTQYLEKSARGIHISSGTYVLSEAAMRRIPPGRSVNVPELVGLLAGDGFTIASYLHDAPWIDNNDAAAIERSERLVREHEEAFGFRARLVSGCPSISGPTEPAWTRAQVP